MKRAAAGLVLTTVVTAIVGFAWGWPATAPAAVFGLLATAIHVAAVGLLEPALEPPFDRMLKRWAAGLALRLAGAALLGAAVVLRPATFSPLPSVAGFLGVLLPLLASEMRLVMQKLRNRT